MTVSVTSNRWIVSPQKNPQASIRLFCFPYAGGSASVFRAWHQQLPPYLEVCPIQYPGHGTRMNEEAIHDASALVAAAAEALQPLLEKPFLFFGHSMGSILAFELALHLQRFYGKSPLQLILAGRNAPDAPSPIPPIHHLPEPEFREGLKRYGGTPEDVLAQEDLMELVSPMLRADFALCETYAYQAEAGQVSCPISVLGGAQDEMVPEENLKDWKRFTSSRFSHHMLPGGHFFLNTHQPELLAQVANELSWLEKIPNLSKL